MYFTGGPVAGELSRPFRTLYRTIGSSFPNRYVFPVCWSGGGGAIGWPLNVVVFAGTSPRLLPPVLRRRAAAAGMADCAGDLYTGPVPTHDVPELRDRTAPADGLFRPGAAERRHRV